MQAEAREQEEVRVREVERRRMEAEEGRNAAEERAERMRMARECLVKEVAEINAKLLEERMLHDEDTGRLRMQLKAEENVRKSDTWLNIQEHLRVTISFSRFFL